MVCNSAIKKRFADVQREWDRLHGQREHLAPSGVTFQGMTVGDLLEWSDPWVEVDYPNTLYLDPDGLVNKRRLMGKIVHMCEHPRWGLGLRIRLIHVPKDDPLKVGDEVFRWGDRLKYSRLFPPT